jgi:signal transduction histidine kinase
VRSRIVGLTVLAAVLATALFGIPLGVAAARYIVADEHHELERIADTAAVTVSGDLTAADGTARLPTTEADVQVAVYRANGTRILGTGPEPTPSLVNRALHGGVASGDLPGRYAAAVPVSDGDTVTGAVLATAGHAQAYQRIRLAWLAMAGLALLAITIAWLIARRLTRRLTRPLGAIEAAADRLGRGDFNVRTHRSGIAELDSVGASLDTTAARLGTLIERERALAADLSHQLRTPLTGLRLNLDAALESPSGDPWQALREALLAADRLDATVNDLLALARDTPHPRQPLNVPSLLEELRERWHGLLAADNRPLRIAQTSKQQHAAISHACARQIADVLLDNARSHGRGVVTIRARDIGDALALDVSDEGAGIPADGADIFLRRSPHAAHTGIGLALARSLAEADGARLTLTRRSPPTFTLFAPPPPPTHQTNS